MRESWAGPTIHSYLTGPQDIKVNQAIGIKAATPDHQNTLVDHCLDRLPFLRSLTMNGNVCIKDKMTVRGEGRFGHHQIFQSMETKDGAIDHDIHMIQADQR